MIGGRETLWRQGSVIAQDDAIAMSLFDALLSDHKLAIIITHDCDLSNENEQKVEIIIGEIISAIDKNFTKCKNVRRLHLTLNQNGQHQFLELKIVDKQSVERSSVPSCAKPDSDWMIPEEEKRVLKQWLAARYGRPAFPNAFETHLRKSIGKQTVERQLDKALENVSKHLVGVFFDLGENRAIELAAGNPYYLNISLVYDAKEGGPEARRASENNASNIQDIFLRAYGSPDVATEIALERCQAVANDRFTISDLRKVDQWRAEHLSLREDPPEPFLPVGEMPA